MKLFTKKLLVLSFITFFLFSPFVYAQISIPNPSVCDDINCVLGRLASFLAPLAGISFLIMFTYGGFLYMTGSDNDEQLSKARSIMIGAGTGIVLILIAPALTEFVLSLFRSTFIR